MSERLPCPANEDGVEQDQCIESFLDANAFDRRESSCFGCRHGEARRRGVVESAETQIPGRVDNAGEPLNGNSKDANCAASGQSTMQSPRGQQVDLAGNRTKALDRFNTRFGCGLKIEDFEGMAKRVREMGRGPDPFRGLYLGDFPTGYPPDSLENRLLWAFGSIFDEFVYAYTEDLATELVGGLKSAEALVMEVQRKIPKRVLEVVQGRQGARKVAWDDTVIAVVNKWASDHAHYLDVALGSIRDQIQDLENTFRDAKFPPSYRPRWKGRHGPWAKQFFAWNAYQVLEPIGNVDRIKGIALLWIALEWYEPMGSSIDTFDNALDSAIEEVDKALKERRSVDFPA